ncbi:MAG: DUF4349 domain-containing protein [Chloroflexota bacterium]|nr:DUF4349 domain-containing protein [Chloroflexota bacterium]
MDESTDRRPIFVVAALVIGGAVLAGNLFMGGQVSTILSTVGASIDTPGSGGGSGVTDGSAPQPTARPVATSNGQVVNAAALPPALLIVRTGTITLEIPDVEAAIRAADGAVTRGGGYIDGSTRNAAGGGAGGTVGYRIPSPAWDTTLDEIRRIATTIRAEEIKTEEVSGQVVDLGARIANLRTTEAALQAIMARATAIKDVLEVQEQLTSTRGEIERLVASKVDLVDRASYGSLTVTFGLPPRPEPTATPVASPGWNPGADVEEASGQLVSIGQATISLGIWLAIVALPLLIAGSFIAFGSLQLVRLARWFLARRDPIADPAG